MEDIPSGLTRPPPLLKTTRRGPLRDRFEVLLETVTPILGGGPRPREVDEIDIVRAATIRGHLRFWWRALNAYGYGNSKTLYDEEARVWGRAGDWRGGRSPVELRVTIENKSDVDSNSPHYRDEDFYALWPARSPLAERRRPGLKFRLSVSAPKDDLNRVRDAVRLWILFGGYGSRTRRGLGALTVPGPGSGWLPSMPRDPDEKSLLAALEDLFSCSGGLFKRSAPASSFTAPVPVLAGASLLVRPPSRNRAIVAWHTALDSLRDFRQGAPVARVSAQGHSLWPEADSIRSLIKPPKGKTQHPLAPAHRTAGPRWPRAGFGLPIGVQFNQRNYPGDPDEVQLNGELNGVALNRLASPLIVKPLPVQGGFVPMALWLNRVDPQDFQVVARRAGTVLPGSTVPLGKFDAPSFDPAKAKSELREAFLDWLKTSQQGWVEI